MTKEQYLKVVERVIDSPRNDKLKITRLKNAFEQYVAETNKRIVERLEELISKNQDISRANYIKGYLNGLKVARTIVKEEGGIE